MCETYFKKYVYANMQQKKYIYNIQYVDFTYFVSVWFNNQHSYFKYSF